MSGKPNPCNSCNGQGKKVQVVRMGNMIQQSVTDCPQCHGKGTVIDLSRACKECFGEGEHKKQKTRSIQLKAGLDNGHKMNLQGKGHYLKHGARSDLHVAVHVLPHPTFKRHENDWFNRTERFWK
jgi:DnaJ-class molecular chaperone